MPTLHRRIFKTRVFARWARKAGLGDEVLCHAVTEIAAGLVDADLGGGLVKKRTGLPGRGKRGGTRRIVVTNRGDRWVFVLGFSKNDRDNLDDGDVRRLRQYAAKLLALTPSKIELEIRHGELEEICHG